MQLRFQISLACAGLTAFVGSSEAQELPIPCVSCAGGPAAFVTSGQANYVVSGSLGTINQQSERAILNWQSFNIGAGNTVNFVQPSSSSAALNRIFQNDPSVILGTLKANGQVFLINQNGIVFGPGAQVNTGALTASTLNVADDLFNGVGIAGAIGLGRAAFEGGSNPDAAIQILEGANLKADQRILIIAPTIENRGTIATPGGQSILAASQDRVYLAADDELRGFLVEVETGGSVENLGEIIAERGNITLAGLAVNQSGRVTATTSTSLNGSVRLLARDGAGAAAPGVLPQATRAGALTFGENSITEVLAQTGSDDTAVDGQEQPLSFIEGMGHTIELQAGAQLVAAGGSVNLQATARPNAPGNADTTSRIYMAAGSVIDVSGDASAVVAMERNQGRIELFGNELADAPVQRDGPLARQEIAVDLREGTPITNTSRLLDGVQRTVGERLSVGGSVTLSSDGDVVLESGSLVDFSGGQVRYLGGYLETTKLVTLDGRIVDIGAVDPNLPYAGFYGGTTVHHDKWGVTETFRSLGTTEFHPGYIEGKDAGRLTINSNTGGVALNGTLLGNSLAGQLQRDPASAALAGLKRPYTEIPLGGMLSVDLGLVPRTLTFALTPSTESLGFDTTLPADRPVVISTQQLREGGITRLEANVAGGEVLLPENVELALAPGGELTLAANEVTIEGDITIPSGDIEISARQNGAQLGSLDVAGTADIDVRGTWINDLPRRNSAAAPTTPVFIDGGTVSLTSQGDLLLAQGSIIDVSAGAHLQSDGAIDTGSAGSISLASGIPNNSAITELELGSELRGYGFGAGGTLELAAASFRISQSGVADVETPGDVTLAASFFASGGFSAFDLRADRGEFLVEDGTHIHVSPRSLQLSEDHFFQPTGTDVRDLTEVTLLPEFMRSASSFSATVQRTNSVTDDQATLRIGTNASIVTEVGGAIALAADSDLYIDGQLRTPGGDIDLTLNNPSASNERGFRPNQALWLGSNARLDAGGAAQVITDPLGVRSGNVVDGGHVTLTAARGYIVTDPGSRIDVSGAQQVFDLPDGDFGRLVPTTIASDAGAIHITTDEGALLFGDVRGQAGGAGAAGGSFDLLLTNSRDPGGIVSMNPGLPQFIDIPREIRIGESFNGAIAEGAVIPSFLNGQALVSADRLSNGGFDVVDLTAHSSAAGSITFEGDVSITAGRRISLNTDLIASDGGAASVLAPYVSLGLASTDRPGALAPAAGSGRLSVAADHIDLRGITAYSGFAQGEEQPAIALASRGDIRMIGDRITGTGSESLPATNNIGSITALADIKLSAAQIYPATLTEFSINVTGQDGRIVIENSGGAAAHTPLSAAGVLELSASEIVQSGVLRAPFGTIELNAAEHLELAPGSITSTSGAGAVIPFGAIELGEDWVYPLGVTSTGGAQAIRVLAGAPEQNVILNAPEVALAEGSVVDLSGGGDLLTYEFVPGPGGSRDILLGNNPQGAFAIVPASNNLFGVYDPLESPAAGIEPGSTITLGAGSGVPAGEYAILPARYALLPGAYLIQPVAGSENIQPSSPQVLADGVTPIVAGKRGYAGTDIQDARWSGYAVLNGEQVRQRAEYNEYLASDFFAEVGGTPGNAGRLTIDADRSILIDGALAAAASGGGRAAQVDFVADSIAVVDARTSATDRVELVDAELQNFAGASLLLGGSRRNADEAIEVQVSAQELTVEDGVDLSAAEIILAASDTVTIARGARVTGTGDAEEESSAETVYRVSGNGAIARVSAGAQARIERTGAAGQTGRVVVEDGATLAADGSIILEASRDVVSAGDLLTSGGSLSLTASLISLGDAPANSTGLVLSNGDLARFQAGELLLNSRSTIDFYGTVAADLNRVGLDATGLRGFDNGGPSSVSINADELALSNTAGAAPGSTGTGSGTLALNAATLTLETGTVNVSGFGDTRLIASRELVGNAQSGLRTNGDLRIETPRLTGGAGADVALTAVGSLTTVALPAPADLEAVTELGAKMTLTAASITHGSRIETPSGIVTLSATGADGITLRSGSSIDVSGRNVDLIAATVGSPGGVVNVLADEGGVTLADGASIDVSGASGAGDAGRITLRGDGEVQLANNATLRGVAAAGETQGTFELTAAALSSGFSSLNALLNSGGFNERRTLSLQTGDVAIAASDTVNARVFELAVDGGNIDVAGHINAAASQGGRVRLSARDNVTLQGSARIDARATGAGEQGGDVELATLAGTIAIQATDTAQVSTIGVGGTDALGNAVDDGYVRLRAPRVGADDVAIADLAGVISGAERIDIEAFRSYDATIIDGTLISAIQADTDAYMANAAAIESGLGVGADSRFHLLPGVDINSAGDLTVASAWDLMNWRYNGEAGVLSLRAAGNLNMSQSLSDGFLYQSVDPDDPLDPSDLFLPERDVVQTGDSWSYRLVAGAAAGAADSLAVNNGTGTVTIGDQVFVRTGTGDIDVAAGKDVILSTATAAIYTAGENRGTGALHPADAEVVLHGDFLDNGGDIRIRAGGDVRGVSDQPQPFWLPRVQNEYTFYLDPRASNVFPAAWAVDTSKFTQGVGTLGGGDIQISAGGDLESLTVALPTTGQPRTLQPGDVDVAGGGDLIVDVAGDIHGGVYHLGRGEADIRSGGSITTSSGGSPPPLPILQLGDAQISLQARTGVGIQTAFNTTMGTQDPSQGLPDQYLLVQPESYFFTYAERAAIDLMTIAGDTDLFASIHTSGGNDGYVPYMSVYPGSLSASSLQGDILINDRIDLFPSSQGNLTLLAGGDITGNDSVNLSDADANLLPNIHNLLPTPLVSTDIRGALSSHAPTPLHTLDDTPVLIGARGTIGESGSLTFDLSKQAHIFAGQDISNLTLVVQHNSVDDVTVMQAGRDITYPALRTPNGKLGAGNGIITVAGPGRLDLIAGRDVNFGIAQGVETIGDQRNAALPDDGADISIWTGYSTPPDYAAFIERYLVESNEYSAKLHEYLARFPQDPSRSDVDNFRVLPVMHQRDFIQQVFFAEIKKGGLANPDFHAGFDAIATLFPESSTDKNRYQGNLTSYLSHIRTVDGGDINLMVPNGIINAGLASSGSVSKAAAQLGIIAQGLGDINTFVDSDMLVNASRVFSLDGGDILIWSSNGDIDAGRGSKAALTIPPPRTTFNESSGQFEITFPAAVSGSGIRSAVSTAGRKPGDVFLFAPRGVVDAGDAGIAAAGNLTIAATKVIGADNIDVGGISVGVPVDSGGLGASLAGVSSVASSASSTVNATLDSGAPDEAATQLSDTALSWLDVFVVGLGKDGCRQDDVECLKRQD